MRIQDFRQPDKWQHFKKTVRRYARDIANRAQRVDVQALALAWDVTGVDISYWQGEIKDPVKLAGMADFVIMRAGYGNDFIDPRLHEYRQVCHEQGIPFGLYWYAKPGKSFDKHAQNFYMVWIDDGGEIPPTFDLEETGGLAKTALESWWVKMYNAFNALTGLAYDKEMTYTSPGFLNKAIALTNWMKRSLLWVAHWTLADFPIIPQEWAVPGFTWTFWQWSSTGKGSDYGVSSRYIDLVRYNGNRAQFREQFGVGLPEPPPEPEPPGDEMKYTVTAEGAGLRIRKTPLIRSDNIVGTRNVGDVVIPLDTTGDVSRYNSYWVLDELGWSAAMWYGVEYLEPFV